MINIIKNTYDNEVEYEKALRNKLIKPISILQQITLPSSVFKYRSFGFYDTEKNWNDNPHWKNSINGEVFFSTPAEFNSNDPNDCKLNIDYKKLSWSLFHKHISNLKDIKKIEEKWKPYIDVLQTNKRIGCFTTTNCTNPEMWNNPFFGDAGKGYCIEYNVSERYFYPNDLIFLKVLYGKYDATELMYLLRHFKQDNEQCNELEKLINYQVSCLAYTPLLFKDYKYREEKEWRLIIPKNRYTQYFGMEDCFIKDMSSQIKAIYLGPNYRQVPSWKEKRDFILQSAQNANFKVYEVFSTNSLIYKLEEIFR